MVDLETTGLRPGAAGDLRDRRRAGPRARACRDVRDAREPETAVACSDRGADGDRAGRASGCAAGGARRAPVPRLRRRRRPRRPQRPLRPRLPRRRGRTTDRTTARSARRRHGLAGAPVAGGPDRSRRARLARPFLRDVGSAVPSSPRRRAGDGRDPARAARTRSGARARAPSPSSSSSRRHELDGSPASARSSPELRPGRVSISSAIGTSRFSTSDAPAASSSDSARTSGRSGSDPPSRRRSARSRGSNGGSSAPSSRRRSRSCGSCASCGLLRTREASGPIDTSTSGVAALPSS